MNQKAPVLFVGHGSPTNVIEENAYSQTWEKIGKDISPLPKAIVVFSAHWETNGTRIAAANDLAEKLAAGVLSPEKAQVAPQLIFNQQLDAWLIMFFVMVLWVIIADTIRVSLNYLNGKPVLPLAEAPYQRTKLAEV